MALIAKDIGIDLGTANTLVYMKNRGIVAREPSVVAINVDSNQIVAVGMKAKRMLGRTPGNIVAVRPLREGVIADYASTSAMLNYFINKTTSSNIISKPRVIVCIPLGVTEVEKRAVEDATIQSGAREVYLIDEPIAAAIGAELPVASPTGIMVVDIGGGTSEIAVISLNGIVSSSSIRTAGEAFDEAIIHFIRKNYGIIAGDRTAEEIKVNIGTAYPPENDEVMEATGRDIITGLPKTIAISSSEILKAIEEPLSIILEGIKSTLEITPPELSSDIMDRGITLTGGGALLTGLDKFLSEELKLPVHVAQNPLNCVVNGIGEVIDHFNEMRDVLVNSRNR